MMGGLAALSWVGTARRAGASVARALSLGELLDQSHHALVGSPVDHFARWETVGRRSRIVTYSLVAVRQSLDGRPTPTGEVMVRTLGGQVDGIGQIVPGEAALHKGQPGTLFIERISRDLFTVTGMAQGHYPHLADSRGTERLRANATGVELVPDGVAAVELLDGLSIAEAERAIHEEIARAR